MCNGELAWQIVGWGVLAVVVIGGLALFGSEIPALRRYFRIKGM
jgi:hypothetical protein